MKIPNLHFSRSGLILMAAIIVLAMITVKQGSVPSNEVILGIVSAFSYLVGLFSDIDELKGGNEE